MSSLPQSPKSSPSSHLCAALSASWRDYPLITLIGGFVLFGIFQEHHILEPLLGFFAVVFILHFFAKRREVETSPPPSPSVEKVAPSPWATSKSMVFLKKLKPETLSLEKRLDALEKHLGIEEPPPCPSPLSSPTKKRSRSFLASLSFLTALVSLTFPASLLTSAMAFKYLDRSEISPALVTGFNRIHGDSLLTELNPVDFEFIATFFGIFLIPAFFVLLTSGFISLRTLFKRQKGFILATSALFIFFFNFVCLMGLWKGLMDGARYWNEEREEKSYSTQDTYHQLASHRTPFWKKVFLVKNLQNLQDSQVQEALLQSLPHNNLVLQQLIFDLLQEHLSPEAINRIEEVLEQHRNVHYQNRAVRLISSVPGKEASYKLLDYDTSLPKDLLKERFSAEDLPELYKRLHQPNSRQHFTILQILYTLDPIKLKEELKLWTRAEEELAPQKLLLRFIHENFKDRSLHSLLSDLTYSEYPEIRHKAQHLERKLKGHPKFRRHPHRHHDFSEEPERSFDFSEPK